MYAADGGHGKITPTQLAPPNRDTLTIYSAVGTISSPSQLLASVNLNMLDYQSIRVEHPHFSIALSILQQLDQNLCTLFWPATLRAWHLVVLSLLCGSFLSFLLLALTKTHQLTNLSLSSNATIKPTEWYDLLLGYHISEVA